LISPALPRWARAADSLALLLIAAAVTISVSGGFRVRIGEWRLAMTSPIRLFMMAALVEVCRHLVAPRPPVYAHLAALVTRWVRSAEARIATAVVVGTRPAILFAGYLGVMMFGYVDGTPANKMPLHDYDSEVLNLQLRWDAGWYQGIAMSGYSYDPRIGAAAQQNLVFFPAYPLITRVVALLLGNRELSFIFGGTLVSIATFLFALAYLYRLARETLDEDQTVAALWLLAAYPFALFYSANYTESMYLLGAAGAFYHFRRGEYGRAGFWALLVGLTRPNGFVLSLPLALIAMESRLPRVVIGASAARAARPSGRTLTSALMAAAMPVFGMLLYSGFIWTLTGNPFAWAAGQIAWGRHYEGLARVVSDRYDFMMRAGLAGYVAQVPVDLLNGLGAIFALASVWPVARRLGLAYAMFIVVNILPPLAIGGFLSAGRFSAVLFPAFVWLASAVPGRHRGGWVATFGALQAINAAMFYTWRPLY
jgi:hypothetical protein